MGGSLLEDRLVRGADIWSGTRLASVREPFNHIQLPVPRGNASLPHEPDQLQTVSRGNASLHVHPRPAQTMGG